MAKPGISNDVTAGDRLGFCVFLTAAVHATLVFGVSFDREDPKASTHTMEITLAQYDDKIAPKTADYLAQANQEGSGDLKEKAELSSPEKAEFRDTVVRETSRLEPEVAPQTVQKSTQKQVVTSTASSTRAVPEQREQQQEASQEQAAKPNLLQRSLEIASLEAKYSEQRQAYAKRPRVTRLTAASTMKTADAFYIQQWQEKVEKIGNLNYPEEARRKHIYGSLRMMVSINSDGTVREIKVLQSSGFQLLDDAAIRTVRLASPFAPFPEDIRKDSDVLEIIRTWQFQQKGLSGS